jgi:hypothetical protein
VAPDLSCPAQEGVLAELPLLPRQIDAATVAALHPVAVLSGEKPAPGPLQRQVECLVLHFSAAMLRHAWPGEDRMNERNGLHRLACTLVGAGPGDPELLTIKAVRAIRAATVLLVDDLVSDGVSRYARRARASCTSASAAAARARRRPSSRS